MSQGRYSLDAAEVLQIDALLASLSREYLSADDLRLLTNAADIARQLPPGVVRFFREFYGYERPSYVRIDGLPIIQSAIGPTPQRWSDVGDDRRTLREDIYLILLGALLGEVFGWGTLQSGTLIHTIVPAREAEQTQSSQGSVANLDWHIEDAFHPNRCDYVGLLCLRNPDRVATTVASVEALRLLSPSDIQTLSEPRYLIRPDGEHLRGAKGLARLEECRVPQIEDYESFAQPCSILFGAGAEPYLRINPPFMAALHGDDDAHSALQRAIAVLDHSLQDVHLTAGEALFVDNYRCVHGRRSFVPKYDGHDRWLRKITISRDLRASRASRRSADSRVIR